ncbi:MAG TPA: hypothetical protein VNZ52_07750 [Candidatus Thermoplasmatota archaeon]|nr:hypothetical protein [Candidatus Thermoplasmatota archaeon]
MRLLAALLLASLLAGCTLGPPGPATRSEGDAPEWTVGDYWVWQQPAVLLGGSGEGQETTQIRWEVVDRATLAGVDTYVVVETVKQPGNATFGFAEYFNKSVATQEIVTENGPQRALSLYRMPFRTGEKVAMGEATELRVMAATETATPKGPFRTIPVERWAPDGENGTVVKTHVIYYAATVGNPVRTEVYQGPSTFYVRDLVDYRCAACPRT